MSNYVQLMLDSGVLAAWRKNDPIYLSAYIKFIQDHEHLLWNYVSLDVIPGSGGRTYRSLAALEQAAALSHKNHRIMRAAGLRPIPVYHQGEDVRWLDMMLDEGESYIGLSPYAFADTREIIRWLDVCYSRLCDKHGRPLVKTHGFGLTSPKLLKRYPFFSADSATWIIPDSSSNLLIPIIKDGKIDYTQKALVVLEPDYDIDMRGPTEQETIKNYLTKVIGASTLDIRNGSALRQLAYIDYFLNLTKHSHTMQFKHRLPELKSAPRAVPEKTLLDPPWTLDMVFTTTLTNTIQNKALTAQDARYRLLSYYQIKDEPSLEAYVHTGLCN